MVASKKAARTSFILTVTFDTPPKIKALNLAQHALWL